MLLKYLIFLNILVFLSLNLSSAAASGYDSARLYTTREEQRETGIKHPINSWLTLAGLMEADWQSLSFTSKNTHLVDRHKESAANLQLAANMLANDHIEANMVYEYNTADRTWELDEAVLQFSIDNWELTLGQHDLAFGEFYSHFASGPIIEFGELKETGATLSYEHKDIFKFSFSAYRSSPHKINSSNRLDFGVSLSSWLSDDISLGISYLSDLADSDELLLDEFGNVYDQRIAGMSTYFLMIQNNYELSVEVLGATGKFSEFLSDRDQPWAWNIELTYCISPIFTCTYRLEGSHELQNAPSLQTGLAINYRVYKYAAFSFNLLHGHYKGTLATDENKQPYESVNTLAAELSIAF